MPSHERVQKRQLYEITHEYFLSGFYISKDSKGSISYQVLSTIFIQKILWILTRKERVYILNNTCKIFMVSFLFSYFSLFSQLLCKYSLMNETKQTNIDWVISILQLTLWCITRIYINKRILRQIEQINTQ